MSSKVVDPAKAGEVDEVDKLEQEVVSGPTFEMPDKFRGKSAEEIAQSYVELEKRSGQQGNEIGQLRSRIDQLAAQPATPPTPKKKVEVDQLLDDPDTVINQAVDENPRLARIEQQLRQDAVIRQKQAFEERHPDWKDVMSSTDFQSWVNASPTRQRMFEAADQRYNYEVGDELFSTFKEIQEAKKAAAQQRRETRIQGDLKAASSETGASKGGVKPGATYYREDLIELRISDPTKYEAMEPEIRRAYIEGRVKSRATA